MKKYIIARDKSGKLRAYPSIAGLKKQIDNISSWLNVRADSVDEAFEQFPILEARYDEANGPDKLRHIIDLN